jgi:hypothetical protein
MKYSENPYASPLVNTYTDIPPRNTWADILWAEFVVGFILWIVYVHLVINCVLPLHG